MSISDWEVKIKDHHEGYMEIKIVFYEFYGSSYSNMDKKETGSALLYLYDAYNDKIDYNFPNSLKMALESIHIDNHIDSLYLDDIKSQTISVLSKKISLLDKLTFSVLGTENEYYLVIFKILQDLEVDYLLIKPKTKAMSEKPYKGRKKDIREQLKVEIEKFKTMGGFVETYGNYDDLNPYLCANTANLNARYRETYKQQPFGSLFIPDLQKNIGELMNAYFYNHIVLMNEEEIQTFFTYLNRYSLPKFTMTIPETVFGSISIQGDDLFLDYSRENIVVRKLGTFRPDNMIAIDELKICTVFIHEQYDKPEFESNLYLKLEKHDGKSFSILIPLRTL